VIALAAALLLQAEAPPCGRAMIEACYSPAFRACVEANPSTPEHSACVEAETERQEARLTAAYLAASARLGPRTKASLKAAQRAWVAFRGAHCRSVFDIPEFGSISRLTSDYCVLDMTIERRLWLERHPESN